MAAHQPFAPPQHELPAHPVVFAAIETAQIIDRLTLPLDSTGDPKPRYFGHFCTLDQLVTLQRTQRISVSLSVVSLLLTNACHKLNGNGISKRRESDLSKKSKVYKTCEELRRENAQTIFESLSGGASEAQDALGCSQALVSKTMGPGASKPISSKLARDIEARFGKPYGWLDNVHFEFARKSRVEALQSAIEMVEQAAAYAEKAVSPHEKVATIIAVYNGLLD